MKGSCVHRRHAARYIRPARPSLTDITQQASGTEDVMQFGVGNEKGYIWIQKAELFAFGKHQFVINDVTPESFSRMICRGARDP